MFKNIIQIAGVIDLEEALMLVERGVDYIGFPLRLKDGREDLSEEDAKHIINEIKLKTKPVLITYLNKARDISDFCNYLGVNIVQLHGHIKRIELERLKELNPQVFIIKSLIIKNDNYDELTELINDTKNLADAFITDTYDPETGRSGATGKTHNWDISRKIVKTSPKPVILAGV